MKEYLKKFEDFIKEKTKRDEIFTDFQCFEVHLFNEIYIVDVYSSDVLNEENFSGHVDELDNFTQHKIKEFRFTNKEIDDAEKIAEKYGCRIAFLS